jgi:tripartite ATP-independent transporter DctM subunit
VAQLGAGVPVTEAAQVQPANSAHWLDRLETLCIRLSRPVAFVGVIGMLAVSGLTMIDVLSRWLLDRSIAATNEVISMTFAVSIAACIPAGLALRVNLKVDLLESKLSPKWKAWLTAIGDVLLALFFLILAWRLAIYAADLAVQRRTTVILQWPQAPFMMSAAILLFFGVAVQAVVALNATRRAIVLHETAEDAASASAGVKIFVLAVGLVTVALIAVGLYDFRIIARFTQTNPAATVTLACVLLWVILLAYVPLAAVMGLIGIVGTAAFIGFVPSMSVFATEMAGFLTAPNVAVLPLFLMMGSFAAVAGLADDAYALAHAVLQRFRGGLAMATIGGCAGFGAVTGSSVATAATIGRVALPEMSARGYSPALATGCVAAGGTLGNLVPPGSGPLVLFALLTEASIGQLFVGSMLPAVLVVLFYLATVAVYVRVVPDAAPAATARHAGELRVALERCIPLFLLFLVVLGGIYIGVFTTTESAAVGAVMAFLLAVWRGKLRGEGFFSVMAETTAVTAMVYSLIFGALVFAFFCEASQLSKLMTTYISDMGLQPLALVALLIVVFIVLGTFMDSYAVMITTVPIVTPLVTGAGYDLVWWGIINLFVVEIGSISPPFGLNMFVLKSIGDVPMSTIFRGVIPFCFAAILALAVLVLFPQIILWLPSTMLR